jgi:bifunctional non-homologous end joining protein LigD
VYEVKHDGFRALAYIDGYYCRLFSRRGNVLKSWPYLTTKLAHAVQCRNAVIDGEVEVLGPDGRALFNRLLFRRAWPHFLAFDLLWLDGQDARRLPLSQRKQRLKAIMRRVESHVRYVDHVEGRRLDFFSVVCRHDLEGVVAMGRHGTYQSGRGTSWLKIQNPDYTQAIGRGELFEANQRAPRTRQLRLA